MRSHILLSLTIFALASSLAFTQTIKPSYQTNAFTIPPEFDIDGLLFMPPFFSYNQTTETFNSLEVSECGGEYFITENLMAWCLDTGDFKTFTVVQISLDLSQVLGSWVIPGVPPKQEEVSYDYFGNYINFFFSDFFISFDTYSQQFVCPIHNQQIQGYGWFLNSSVVTVEVDGDNAEIIFNPCGGGKPIVTIGVKEGEQGPIYGLNQSTVFLRTLENNGRAYYSSGVFDLTGKFHFGHSYFEAYGEPLNDTHVALINPEGVGLYVVAPNLAFVQVANFPLGINSTELALTTVRGSSMVYVFFEDGRFLFDFSNNEISEVYTIIPPIFFNNGSIVNLTVHGYFIQSPGESIYFIKNQVLDFYVNSTDTTKVYALYAKTNNNSNSTSCSLLAIDGTGNTIKDVTFPQCPVQGAAYIKDVTFDNNGNLVLAYTDAEQSLKIATSTQVLGPFENTKGISPISITVNLQAQTATYAGFNYTNDKEFLAGTFSLTSGKSNQSGTVTVGTLNNYIQKLTENYYLVSSSFQNGTTTLFVWNTTGLSQINPLHFENFCNKTGLVALGVSEFNPKIFTTVVCQNGGSQYTIVSNTGKTTKVDSTTEYFLEIELVDNTTFVVYEENIQYTTESFFNLIVE